jgi:uncharacterized membrane protein HdeD (DUF308 family)
LTDHNRIFTLRNTILRSLIVLFGLIIAYIIFIALISINVGFTHLQQNGFWVPILAGSISIGVCLWLFISFSRIVIDRMKDKDIIDNI